MRTLGIPLVLSLAAAALLVSGAREPGLANRKDVMFACDFESPEWYAEFGLKQAPATLDTVAEDAARKFEPLRGKALRVRIPEGGNLGSNLRFDFRQRTGAEPEEIYFRYHLRLADDWNPIVQGGKFPGISGTYGRAGWGGRRVNGTDGWSARGSYSRINAAGETPIGFYCYHVDMKGKYGSVWVWDGERRGYLQKNRWYAVEQYAKMNTPGKNDGILRAWVDGDLAFEKTDLRFRDTADLKIEAVWLNVYEGGTKPAHADQHIYIDNVAVAANHIGPMAP
jgi:hypothetical protein